MDAHPQVSERTFPWWMGLAVGAIAIAIALRVSYNTRAIAHAEERTCHRVQTLRDTVNRNSETIFLTLDKAARNPQVPAAIRAQYKGFTDRVVFLPPTDCKRAVHQDGYRPMRPVPMRDWLHAQQLSRHP